MYRSLFAVPVPVLVLWLVVVCQKNIFVNANRMNATTTTTTTSTTTKAPSSKKMCLPPDEKESLARLKAFIYTGITESRGSAIAAGVVNPIENVDWHHAVWIHFRIEHFEELANYLDLPNGMSMAPIRILESDEKDSYFLTLSIKQVFVSDQGPDPTTQLDWIVYVTTPERGQQTNLMIIDSIFSFDMVTPLDSMIQSTIYLRDINGSLVLTVGDVSDSELVLELDTNRLVPTTLSMDFIHSLDRIYWPNGVYSRIFSNGSLSRSRPLVVTSSNPKRKKDRDKGIQKKKSSKGPLVVHSSLKNSKARKSSKGRRMAHKMSDANMFFVQEDSFRLGMKKTVPWLQFVTPEPEHMVYFPHPILLGQEVWINAADMDGDLAAAKGSIYSNRATLESQEIQAGTRDPVATFVVETATVPSYFIIFRIREDRVPRFQETELPAGFTLARIRWREHVMDPEYLMVLNVYESSGIAPGFRAEWSVFVTADSDGVGKDASSPRFMVLEAISSTPSFDPVNTFTPAATSFNYTMKGRTVTSAYNSTDGTSFFATIELPEDDVVVRCYAEAPSSENENCDIMSEDFVVANDEIYWRNGVMDRGLYSDNLRQIPITVVSKDQVSVDLRRTQWAEYLDENEQLEVILFSRIPTFFLSPMFNLEEMAVCTTVV